MLQNYIHLNFHTSTYNFLLMKSGNPAVDQK